MGSVVEFSQRLVKLGPHLGIVTQVDALQLFLEENIREFEIHIETLGKSLRDIDSVICRIDDPETRKKMQLRSQAIREQFFVALQRLMKSLASREGF